MWARRRRGGCGGWGESNGSKASYRCGRGGGVWPAPSCINARPHRSSRWRTRSTAWIAARTPAWKSLINPSHTGNRVLFNYYFFGKLYHIHISISISYLYLCLHLSVHKLCWFWKCCSIKKQTWNDCSVQESKSNHFIPLVWLVLDPTVLRRKPSPRSCYHVNHSVVNGGCGVILLIILLIYWPVPFGGPAGHGVTRHRCRC